MPPGMRHVSWLFGTWTLAVLAFLYLPILLLILYSFNDSELNVVWQGFTLKWYTVLLEDRPLKEAMLNSLIIASWVTLISTLLGTLGAWLLYRYVFPARRAIDTLVFIPMVVPEVIMGISLRIFFASIGLSLGKLTIIIAHATFCFPFVMVAIQARLAGLDPALEEAAQDLGATPFQAFRKIIVPYLLPAIIAGALMSFTLSIDEYIVTVFVTGPGSQTFPIKVYGLAKKGLNPSLNAISTIFILATGLLTISSEWLRKKRV